MRSSRLSPRDLCILALAAALAMVLSYVESLLPPISTVAPGIRLGLANVITVFLLYRYGWGEAAVVTVVRVLLSGLLFSGVTGIAYGLAGGALSILGMTLLHRFTNGSTFFVSACGGVLHNVGQVAVAAAVFATNELFFTYLPILAVAGTIAGVFVGILAALLLRATDRFFPNDPGRKKRS